MKFRDNAWRCQVGVLRSFASLRMTREDEIKELHYGTSSYYIDYQEV